jgi:hypothetical protein
MMEAGVTLHAITCARSAFLFRFLDVGKQSRSVVSENTQWGLPTWRRTPNDFRSQSNPIKDNSGLVLLYDPPPRTPYHRRDIASPHVQAKVFRSGLPRTCYPCPAAEEHGIISKSDAHTSQLSIHLLLSEFCYLPTPPSLDGREKLAGP